MASTEVVKNPEVNSTTDGASEAEKTPEGDTNKRPIEENNEVNNEVEAKKPKLEGEGQNQV